MSDAARLAELDERLLALMSERAALVAAPGAEPVGDGASPPAAPDAARLDALAARNPGPLPDAAVRRVFVELLSACHALVRPLRVAYLGPEGTYSQAAADAHFGHAVETVPERAIPDIFQAVEAERVDFGVVPVENSTEGAVNHTLDLLMSTHLRICGEVRLRIRHHLMVAGGALGEVRSVHAHPQSLAQCRGWLDAHLPDAERVAEDSNAAAARVALGTPGVAAIAGAAAAERYGLVTLQAGIEDVKTNTTRFLVMGDADAAPTGDDTTSLLVSVSHRPGGLRRLLEPLEEAGLSMTRIESRPARSGLWEYVFFIDVAGHRAEPGMAAVLERLAAEVPLVRVLGSYPKAV